MTHRTFITNRYYAALGGTTAEGMLMNTTTLGITLGFKLSIKFQNERMVDFTLGCSSPDTSVRIFGSIPMLEYSSKFRKLKYFKKRDMFEIEPDWIENKSRKIMIRKMISTYCKGGSEAELNCDAHTGRFSEYTWSNI
ncbi:unnamed protein product [Candida verbasci]|uniref:Uncharacterized protein n=1 Tax=Candida verbasci TaxID=1227364 RepID=A0A9W4U0C1_9ASCO|nr:unnamed protein product [Candida verbasci]